jgi:acyl-CoA thioester hydrolase
MTRATDRIFPAEQGMKPPPELPHPRPTLFTIDVDEQSLSESVPHVNNVVYLAWFDRIAELAGDAFGHDRMSLAGIDRMWFAARHEIDYLAEVFASQQLIGATWIHDHRRTSCRRDTLISRVEDGQPVARARSTWTWIDLKTRRPCRMPPELIEQLDPLHARDAAETST